MQKLLPFLLFFLSTTLYAQQVEWSINVAPTISYRVPQNHNLSAQAATIQAGEKAMHTFDFGPGMRAALNKHMKIGAAILYSQKGFSNIHASAIFNDRSISRSYSMDFIQNYLEIPVLLTYTVMKKRKQELYSMLGISNSLLLSDKINVTSRSGEVSEEIKNKISTPYLESSHQHNIGLLFGWGVMIPVDTKTSLGIEAQGKLMLTPLHDKVSASQRYLSSFGLNFRFIRNLNSVSGIR